MDTRHHNDKKQTRLRTMLDAAPMAELKAAIARKQQLIIQCAKDAEEAIARASAGDPTAPGAEFLRFACNFIGESPRAILSTRRKEPLCTHRHVVQGAARLALGLSYKELQKLFNRADHTALIYAFRKTEETPQLKTWRDKLIAAWNASRDTPA